MKSEWLTVIHHPVLIFLLVVPGSESNDLQNVALNKKATQGSTYQFQYPHSASLALNGNPGINMLATQSCTHTSTGVGAWWMVDLANVYRIATIGIQNRGDCCGDRLRNLSIQIGRYEGELEERDFFQGPGTNGMHFTFQIGGYLGRYVKLEIVNTLNAILTLCEVQVMGKEFRKDQRFRKMVGKKSTADTIYEVNATTTVQCAHHCLGNSSCFAANFDVVYSTCHLLPTSEPRLDATNYILLIMA